MAGGGLELLLPLIGGAAGGLASGAGIGATTMGILSGVGAGTGLSALLGGGSHGGVSPVGVAGLSRIPPQVTPPTALSQMAQPQQLMNLGGSQAPSLDQLLAILRRRPGMMG